MLNIPGQLNKGSRELHELLTIISNADEYSHRLKELSDAETAAIKAKEDLTKAQDLDAELKKIAAIKKQTEEINNEAANHLQNVKRQATAERKHMLDAATKNIEAMSERAKAEKQKANQLLEQAKENERKTADALKEAELLLTERTSMMESVDQLRKEYINKMKKIQAFSSELSTIEK